MDPRDALVLAVGIDRYAAGQAWALDGPVDDAIRFAQFFLTQGVAPERVTLLLSPEPDAGAVPDGVEVCSADRPTVRETLVRSLPARAGRDLYVVWGGHGVVDTDRHRRLYYADATDADAGGLDLDSILLSYASDLVPTMNRQTWIVDVCQTHLPTGVTRVPGRETFPSGEPVIGRTQDVLFAAGIGQAAANLSSRRTGLFSREVLRLLEAGPDGLDQPESLVSQLRKRFMSLRSSGLTQQTPTYFWYRNALGDEGQVLAAPTAAFASPTGPDTPLAALRPVIDALLEIPQFLRPNDREEILSLLRGPIYGAIRRNPAARLDAISVVRTCLQYPGGLPELVEAVRFFAPEDPAMDRFVSAATVLTDRRS